MEPPPPHLEALYTAWHFYLFYCLEFLCDPKKLEVHAFEKLGTLPLEADILLLRKVADLTGAAKLPDFDFLWPYLALYTVVEYKSPADRLTLDDFDKARAYGILCKRKFGLRYERDVRILLLYSHKEGELFDICEENGFPFSAAEPGVRVCTAPRMQIAALNLVEVGQRFPHSLVNMFSTRHELFIQKGQTDRDRADLAEYIYRAILRKELSKTMDPDKLKGMRELALDMDKIRQSLLQELTPEERIQGLSLEQRLQGLSPEDLTPKDKERLQALLGKSN